MDALGYPKSMIVADKLVTALQRGAVALAPPGAHLSPGRRRRRA